LRGMGAMSRNAPCPCGSGLKHKRCCLAVEQREREAARFEDAAGKRISNWAAAQFSDELEAALQQFAGPEPKLDDRDLQIFVTWFCSDRELAGGGTPSQRYAVRTDIDARERDVAARIARASLGLQRVRAAEAERWIELEDVLSGSVVRVRSGEVSREAARWDLLLCRLMDDEGMPSLWGPALFYAPDEEPELVAEVERLADAHGIAAGDDRLTQVFRIAALDLMRFVPASRCVEPSLFTAEGDPIVNASASWRVADAATALELLDDPPELAWVGESEDGTGETFQWTADRAQLLAHRPTLPPGALCFESSLTGLPGRICLATFDLTDEELCCMAVSEVRLDAAIELIGRRLGELANLRERTVLPFEPHPRRDRGAARRRREPPPGLTAAQTHELEQQLLNDHFRRWLDDPIEPLGGRTPRQAAHGDARGELELLLRGIENRAERARRDGIAWPDLGWLRGELGLDADQLAA
jgi:SEC-C motif-containing protein